MTTPPLADMPSTLTIEQTMKFLQVSRSTVERRIADKTLRATRKFGHPRILTESRERSLAAKAGTSAKGMAA